MPIDTTERELVLTRLFDAPIELVFQAYTHPAYLPRWWGPDGFTVTNREIDIRPGGVWRFVMHGPDGKDWDNRIRYREIESPHLLTYDHDSDVDDDPNGFYVEITLAEENGQTRLTQRSVFASPEAVEMVKAFGAVELGYQTLGRLEAHLAAMR